MSGTVWLQIAIAVPEPNRKPRIVFERPCRVHWPKRTPEVGLIFSDVENTIATEAEAGEIATLVIPSISFLNPQHNFPDCTRILSPIIIEATPLSRPARETRYLWNYYDEAIVVGPDSGSVIG
jgi:hypothetical protein